jgi:osmotically-inducible protein OsmY
MVSIRRDRRDQPRSRLSDRELRATIVSRLRENPYTQDGRIRVTVHDGVVRLSGRVPSSLARTVAGEDVESVPGVAEVELGLGTSPPESPHHLS